MSVYLYRVIEQEVKIKYIQNDNNNPVMLNLFIFFCINSIALDLYESKIMPAFGILLANQSKNQKPPSKVLDGF